MFTTYFKTSFRSLRKNKVITLINILGLSIGISSALVIYLIIQYDYSFDRFEPDRDRIYRIVSEGENWHNSGVPAPMHEAVAKEVPGIERSAAFFQFNGWDLKVSIPQCNNIAPHIFTKQEKVAFADKEYFDVFPHEWLAGNAGVSLQDPYQLVLTEGRARTWFPSIPLADIIGRRVLFNDTIRTTVSGIVKDIKGATDFDNQAFISLSTIPARGLQSEYSWTEWGSTNSASQLLIKLGPRVSPAGVEKEVINVAKRHFEGQKITFNTNFHLQPLDDIHFNGDYDGPVSKATLRNLIILAGFVLLLGAINFINLSTAQSSERAKEIGIRKTLGSSKRQLVVQFLQETFLLTTLSTVLSVVITPLLMRAFSGFIPEGLHYAAIFQPHVFLFLIGLILVISVLSGFYPGLVLTRFKPVLVLKKQISAGNVLTRGIWLRKTLTISQFVIAQVLIIGTLIVTKQIHYALHKDMGFRKDAIVNFNVMFDFFNPDHKKLVLLDKLRAIPEVEAASIGNQSPAFNGSMTTEIKFKDGNKELTVLPDERSGDTAFISLYHIRLLAGRNVFPADTPRELLINETLGRQLGFQQPADALGKIVEWDDKRVPVVGVMADFNLASVRTTIHPLIFWSETRYGYVMHVALRSDPASWPAALSKMKDAWKSIYPDKDFDYKFLDKSIEKLYTSEQDLSTLLSWSAGIAIFISCLGLLGLVIFTVNQRTKEIGIRKVLGAKATQIIALLSKDFVRLVSLAFFIAVPIAWWAMHQWLRDFAYHTDLSWWIFLLSGASMVVIALVILCIRTGRAAMSNPVDALRSE